MTGGTGQAYDAERLALQAEIVARAEDRALRAVGFPFEGRALDVGCGNGAVMERLRSAYPRLALDGVELRSDLADLARARAHGGAIHEVDASRSESWAPFEDRYDVAYARLVARQASGVEDLVRGMARAVRPGGRVVLIDADDSVLEVRPQIAELAPAIEETYASVRARGADPRAGHRLPELLRLAGLVDLSVATVPLTTATIGGQAGRHAFRALLSFLWLDPEARTVIPSRAALARSFEAWVDDESAYGAWSLIVVAGTRPEDR